jgi:hypothetical protein
MKYLPKKIIRLDDGAEFLLNEVSQRYSLWLPFMEDGEDHLTWEYDYDTLINSPAHKGKFKVADGKEDLLAIRQRWFDSMNQPRGGHGDGDDGC